MAELSFAKLDKLPPLPIGKVFDQKGSSHIFRVIGPNNEVERFTGSRSERAQTLKLWARTKVTDSRFAELVEWPVLDVAPPAPGEHWSYYDAYNEPATPAGDGDCGEG
jgi:hypothetical protein